MKNAELFRNGQSKPEFLRKVKSDKIPGERYEEIWINCHMSRVDPIFHGKGQFGEKLRKRLKFS